MDNKAAEEVKGVFIFKSYYEALKALPNNDLRWELFDAIMRSGLGEMGVTVSAEICGIFAVLNELSRFNYKKAVENMQKNSKKKRERSGKKSAELKNRSESGGDCSSENCNKSASNTSKNSTLSAESVNEINRPDFNSGLNGLNFKNLGDQVGETVPHACAHKNKNKNKTETDKNSQMPHLLMGDCVLNELRVVVPRSAPGVDDGESRENNNLSNSGHNGYIPTLEEVKDYITKHNINISPQQFYGYYNYRNWRTQKGEPIKNWVACLTKWAENKEIRQKILIEQAKLREEEKQKEFNEASSRYDLDNMHLDLNSVDIDKLFDE